MKKILILQTNINGQNGYMYDHLGATDISENKFDDILKKSVLDYCKKHNYDYKMMNEKPLDLDIDWFHDERNPSRKISTTLVRYYYMFVKGYDAVVSLDNDIYITPDSEPLPEIVGHMGVHDILMDGVENSDSELGKFIRIIKPRTIGVINGGVQMVDSETGKMIKNYIKQVCDKRIPPIANYYSDQSYINYFRSKFPERSKLLEPKWNLLVSRYPYEDLIGINFVHYSGFLGRKQFYVDLKRGLLKV